MTMWHAGYRKYGYQLPEAIEEETEHRETEEEIKNEKNFRVNVNKKEAERSALKDGGAHAKESETWREIWRKRDSAFDYRKKSCGGAAPEVGEVDAEPRQTCSNPGPTKRMEPTGATGVCSWCYGLQRRRRQRGVPRVPAPPAQGVPEAGFSGQDGREA